MKQIYPNDLIDVLSNIKGGTMVNLTTLSTLTIPTIGKVTKWCKQSIQVGCSYENAVNKRLEKQGSERNFVASGLRWGVWYIPNRIITHKGEFYGRFYKTQNSNEQVVYFVGNRQATPIEIEIIKTYDHELKDFSQKQSRYGLTTKQVRVRNYRLSNILSLSTSGEVYNVVKPQYATR